MIVLFHTAVVKGMLERCRVYWDVLFAVNALRGKDRRNEGNLRRRGDLSRMHIGHVVRHAYCTPNHDDYSTLSVCGVVRIVHVDVAILPLADPRDQRTAGHL